MDNYSIEQQNFPFSAFNPNDSLLQKPESILESNKASERKSLFYLRDSVDNSKNVEDSLDQQSDKLKSV